MLQSQGPPSLLGWLQNYRKWMEDKIVRKQVFRHLSCPTLRSTHFTPRQWSHVGKRKEVAVTTHKSLLVLTGSCWFCFEHWFLEGVGWSLSLLILFLLQFRGNPWCHNGLAKSHIVSKLRGDWVSYGNELLTLNLREGQSVVVLMSTLAYVSQRSKRSPSQWSWPSSAVRCFPFIK